MSVGGLFASGRIVDAILLLTAAEAVVLLRRGRTDLLATLLAGVALLAALRLALAGAAWPWLALALLASLAAHLADLARRWR
jgi:hypothetical protein